MNFPLTKQGSSLFETTYGYDNSMQYTKMGAEVRRDGIQV